MILSDFDHRRQIVLVVDDNPESLSMVATAIEEAGMTVLVARDGQTALELVTRIQPDVVLMDAVMPGLDGFETCARLKSGPDMIHAPIIFMTGLSEPEHILRGLEVGGVDYVTKPVNPDELIARLTVHLTNAKMIESAQNALDAGGRPVLAVTEEGQLIWASPEAKKLVDQLANFVDDGNRLTNPKMLDWLSQLVKTPLSQTLPFRLGKKDDLMEICLLGIRTPREILLSIEKISDTDPKKALISEFSLTAREAEILIWLSRGKTNRDIGDILSISARTVNKHLEQIFQKLGVDNRTSAAVITDRICRKAGAV
ncbi:DNA-binding response regulator [Sneathiella sp.]|uniref:response regulator transcription factor n=1 Tax=Sneathiella sp. TaxID=1964365 RepID=UPI0026063214|nr:DNA-binding response regulator [Sneathiella sp.]MDF2366829.1 DNA-binding response regulator [Sneathiella sp.]